MSHIIDKIIGRIHAGTITEKEKPRMNTLESKSSALMSASSF